MAEERTLADGSVVEVETDPDGSLVVKWESGKPVGRIVPEEDGTFTKYDPEGNEVTNGIRQRDESSAIQALCEASEEAFYFGQH